MRVGIHLPQFGKAITPGGVQRAAREAEQQGFDDVWVSDHLVNPSEQAYPAPYILDPLITLALAAGATEGIGLGTSVLVGPQYTSPLALANSLASLDAASDGRLTVGMGIGWSKREYEALGAAFTNRGPRLDEMIRLFRTVWEHSTADFDGEYYSSFEQIRVLPLPAHRIPIWIGGSADGAIERALRNDGYHAIGLSPEQTAEVVARLRTRRPDDDFVISLRVSWDLTSKDPNEMADEADAYREAGCGALHISPERGDIDTWMQGQSALAKVLIDRA
ncbi:MAG TPA: TIGR03619 family F420-dependent LLM class oxidoreductase [Acidimicrobiia bacterium]|nr:TIGR03619 family F420-dependent LLM class oxidoreductase [Acidimicrobiia bacterium]